MPERDPITTTNLDRYGNDALSWSRAYDQLTAGVPGPETLFILSTTRPDGRPHATGIGALWYDGDLYFTSHPTTRKARNLAENAAATITVRVKGIDLVLEGDARRTTDPTHLEAVAALFREGGWPAQVAGVATEKPDGATRWRFER